LSEVEIGRLAAYDGPTWLDEAIVGKLQVQKELPGFPAELQQALADRGRWLAGRGLADVSGSNEVAPKPHMMRSLRQRETAHLAETLSRQLNAIHVPHEPGSRISGVYERAIATPTGKLAVTRSADTFTLALCKPALEPLRGRAVLGWASSAPIASCGPSSAAARCLGGGEHEEPCRQSNPRGVRASDKRRNSSASRRMGLRAALGKETRSMKPNHLGTSGWIMSRAGLCPVAP
jgi:uncharacterized protein DUF3363